MDLNPQCGPLNPLFFFVGKVDQIYRQKESKEDIPSIGSLSKWL